MTKMRDSMPVVFAVLAGIFLLMIIFEWGGQGAIFSPKGDAQTLGVVNGYKITQQDYNKVLEAVSAKLKQDNKSTSLNEEQEAQAEDQAWEESVKLALERQSREQMGVTVTDDELRDVIYYNPPPEVRRQFTDSLGTYHEDAYIKALRDPKNDSIVRGMENETREQVLHMKWQQAMVTSIRVTDEEARTRYVNDSAKAMIQAIRLLPSMTADNNKQVTDQDIKEYYDSHGWKYHQDETRKFKFVSFPLRPNARDTAMAMETANSLRARLAEVPLKDLDTVGKELALDYSDLPYEGPHPITMREIGNDTSLLNVKAGDTRVAIVNGKVTVARVIQVFDTGMTYVHTRSIDIALATPGHPPTPNSRDSALAAATKLAEEVRAGADFAEMVRKHSDDPRSAFQGGDKGWDPVQAFSPEVRDQFLKTPINGIVGPFDYRGAFQIAQVLGRTQHAVVISSITIPVKPSRQTIQMLSQSANIFREQAVKNGFEQAAKTAGYKVFSDAPPVQHKGQAIFSNHEFVNWVFQSSKDDISQAMKMPQQHFIMVAQVTDIIPAGPRPLEDVKQQIREEVAKRKAVAALATRAQQVHSQIASLPDWSSVPTVTGDATLVPLTVAMGPAESVNGIPSGEYGVNNWAYSAKPGTTSPPLKGENGWYIVRLLGRTVPSEQDFQRAKGNIVKAVYQEKVQRLMLEWPDKQKENATIVDYRVKK